MGTAPHVPQELVKIGGTYFFDNELGDAVTDGNAEIFIREICQEHANLAAIIGVNDASHGVNTVLGCEARARGNAAIYLMSTIVLAMGSSKASESVDIQVPAGTAMLISVSTLTLPLAGTTTSLALYRSCPAANALPLVGAFALSLSSCTCKLCSAAAAAAIDGAMDAEGCRPIGCVGCGVLMFASGVGVAVPESVPRGRVEAWSRGVVSIMRVRLGSGEDGREGGSWVREGVADMLGWDGMRRLR